MYGKNRDGEFMKDFDIVVKIGVSALNEDLALDQYSDILFFIQDNLDFDNYSIEVIERGEYL